MSERNTVEKAVFAALEREQLVNLHHNRVGVEYDIANRVLTLEGEMDSIVAKRRAYECASRIADVDGVIDRLRVRPAESRGDGAVRTSVTQALLAEPALRDYAFHVYHKGIMETLRAVPGSRDVVGISIEEGVVELTGHVGSLSHKRLVGALAWWAPGCRDVLNELQVNPPEADGDDEIADALRLVLEKDPLVIHAYDIGVAVHNAVVTLSGVVTTEEERRMAEFDAWYLVGVRNVQNGIEVRRLAGRA
jgi:osmotically-inducible protein OsmY